MPNYNQKIHFYAVCELCGKTEAMHICVDEYSSGITVKEFENIALRKYHWSNKSDFQICPSCLSVIIIFLKKYKKNPTIYVDENEETS